MPEAIRSPANPIIKDLRRLHRADERRRQRRFIAEGHRVIDALLAAGARVELILASERAVVPEHWPQDVLRLASVAAIARASALRSSPGLLAAFTLPDAGAVEPARGGLLLDGIAEPGNLGSILRSAAAFGITQVLLHGGADPYAPKVVQGSAGTLAVLRIAAVDSEGFPELAGAAPVLALTPSGGLPPECWPAGAAWLVLGNEAHGVGPELRAHLSDELSLPMGGRVESLNVAVAAGIACFLRRSQG